MTGEGLSGGKGSREDRAQPQIYDKRSRIILIILHKRTWS